MYTPPSNGINSLSQWIRAIRESLGAKRRHLFDGFSEIFSFRKAHACDLFEKKNRLIR